MVLLPASALLVLLLGQSDAPRVKETAFARVTRAEGVARDPVVRDAILASNATPESAAEIRRRDSAWTANKSDPLRLAVQQAPCSERIREMLKDDGVIVEAFAMNDRGTVVCTLASTSDYWQGDEPKWQRTFVDGRDPFVDEPAFDASTGTHAIQVSVPMTHGGKRIGAVTLTLKLARHKGAESPKP
jgi:hypothetical protein